MRLPAFTLVELLVVVAIIAILAGIALPNFLEAQVRSKVARVQADHRTIAGAIEAYSADWGTTPRMTWNAGPFFDPSFNGYAGNNLTTPVAYLGSIEAAYDDPFATMRGNTSDPSYSIVGYFYHGTATYELIAATQFPFGGTPQERFPFVRRLAREAGAWSLSSVGPDLYTPAAATELEYWEVYDPTNGTVSSGNVFRTQRAPAPAFLDFAGVY